MIAHGNQQGIEKVLTWIQIYWIYLLMLLEKYFKVRFQCQNWAELGEYKKFNIYILFIIFELNNSICVAAKERCNSLLKRQESTS